MSELTLCQGSRCHTYNTKDRLKGVKGSKTYQTRRRSGFYYGNGNFCTLNCQNDWWKAHGTRAVEYIGILRERKVMTPENSWTKRERYSWERNEHVSTYYSRNVCTNEERPLTESQYNDDNYTLNT